MASSMASTKSARPSMDVTRADQDDINRFSLLSTQSLYHSDLYNTAKRSLESMQEALEELELLEMEDEEGAKVPVRCGTAFLLLPVDQAKAVVEKQISKTKKDADIAKSKLADLEEQMNTLKERLYSKFGDAIQLELDPTSTPS